MDLFIIINFVIIVLTILSYFKNCNVRKTENFHGFISSKKDLKTINFLYCYKYHLLKRIKMNQEFKSLNEIREWIFKLKSDIGSMYFYRDQSYKNIKLEIRKKAEQILKRLGSEEKVAHSDIEEIKKFREKLHAFLDTAILKKIHKITSKDIGSLMKNKSDSKIFSSLKKLLEIQRELGNFEEGYILNFNSRLISNKFDSIEKTLMSSSSIKKYDPSKLKQIISSLRSVRSDLATLTNGEAIEKFLQSVDDLRSKISKNLVKSENSSMVKKKQALLNENKTDKKTEGSAKKKSLKIVISNKKLDYSILSNLFKSAKQSEIKKMLTLSPFRKFLQNKIEVVIYDVINELKGKTFDSFEDDFSSHKDQKIKQIILQKTELLKEVSKRLDIKIPETEFDIILYDISDNNSIVDSGEKEEFEFFDDSSDNNDLFFVSKEYVIYYY